ncbi:chaperone NapD [Solidesulfovibrio sp.]|uniref:chaperone NapD n=1 Tax=Solidesulfovibrio sp. TaxID=2910990 RepID=UPI00260D2D9F|nr:chaperone NapD [Solidesulfovibrio sp.]
MAVASFIVQTSKDGLAGVKETLARRPDATVLPWEGSPDLVVVIERPSDELPAVERAIRATPGVLAVAAAYLSLEDELSGATPRERA